jgi:predicted benzoate:H+ symporter BenE
VTKRKYDSTVARMAGNIAAGLVDSSVLEIFATMPAGANDRYAAAIASVSVALARAIVAETLRTEPVEPTGPPSDQEIGQQVEAAVRGGVLNGRS